jgi:hypothetical protein
MMNTDQHMRSAVSVIRTPRSSWIRGIGYHNGILIILTGEEGGIGSGKGHRHGRGRKVTGAILYSGVPSWIVGLLVAARKKSKASGEGRTAGQESVGATYCRLVKGKYPSQTVGPEKIDELLKLIGA